MNEIVTYSYCDLYLPRVKRQEILAKAYFFECKCERCVEPMEQSIDRFMGGFICRSNEGKNSCEQLLPWWVSDLEIKCPKCSSLFPRTMLLEQESLAANLLDLIIQHILIGETKEALILCDSMEREAFLLSPKHHLIFNMILQRISLFYKLKLYKELIQACEKCLDCLSLLANPQMQHADQYEYIAEAYYHLFCESKEINLAKLSLENYQKILQIRNACMGEAKNAKFTQKMLRELQETVKSAAGSKSKKKGK